MLIVYLLSQAGLDVVVPDALQIRRLRARPRAGDQQVAAVLEVERGEAGVGRAVPHGREALVGGQSVPRRRAEVESDAPEERAVVGEVPREELAVRPRAAHAPWRSRLSGSRHLEARRRRQPQRGRQGVDDAQPLLVDLHSPALPSASTRTANASPSPYQRACRFSESFRWSSALARSPASGRRPSEQPAALERARRERLLAVQPHREAQLRGAGGRQAHDDRLVGRAREDLAGEGDVADPVAHADDRAVEVQLAPVVGRGLVAVDRAAGRRAAGTPAGAAGGPSASRPRGPALPCSGLPRELPHLRQATGGPRG